MQEGREGKEDGQTIRSEEMMEGKMEEEERRARNRRVEKGNERNGKKYFSLSRTVMI